MERFSLLTLVSDSSSIERSRSSAHVPLAVPCVPSAPNTLNIIQPTLLCRRCEFSPEFSSVHELRSHFRLKHATAPKECVGESSGGDSGNDSSSPSEPDAEEISEGRHPAGDVSGPLTCVSFLDAGHDRPVWIYRALLLTCRNHTVAAHAADLRHSSGGRTSPIELLLTDLFSPGEKWAVFAFSSGYFMSSVWEVAPPADALSNAHALGRPLPTWPRCILHKRHHRYTTRAKQGGSQSAHDSKGHAAKSVGAQMRRAGERHLLEDVHGIFANPVWTPAIREAARIIIAAPRRERPAFMQAAAPTLAKHDPRIFAPPFETGRPSLEVVTSIVRTLLSAARPIAPAPGDLRKPVVKATTPLQSTDGRSGASSGVSHVAPSCEGELAGDGTVPMDALKGPLAPVEPSPVVRQPQFGPRKKRAAKRAGKVSSGGPKHDCADSELADLDVILASHLISLDEGHIHGAETAALHLLRDTHKSTEAAVDNVAIRTRVPRAALAASLNLSDVTFPASGSAGQDLQRLQAASERLSTISGLLDAGANPSEAFAAVGLDGLAAAALVASSAAVFIDWSQFTAAPKVRAPADDRTEVVLSAAVGGKVRRNKASASGGTN